MRGRADEWVDQRGRSRIAPGFRQSALFSYSETLPLDLAELLERLDRAEQRAACRAKAGTPAND
ncbi:hypothetical protein [Jiella sp. M17.18]|uniref:hypothetical protein n=1 Tax=Jiella sp. M17.18 TaxID=3234247 RepID=UPI0034DF47F6